MVRHTLLTPGGSRNFLIDLNTFSERTFDGFAYQNVNALYSLYEQISVNV